MTVIDGVKKLFDHILEPKLKWNINTLGLLKRVEIVDERLVVDVSLVTDDEEQKSAFQRDTLNALKEIYQGEVELLVSKASVANSGIKGIKNIILVASGKGGVGKSTVSVNLASSLAKQGLKVGLLDADIYGPSIPIMLGCVDKHPVVLGDEYLKPIEVHNLKFISIGSLVEKDRAISWRGQLVSGTILQFIEKTAWEELDFLVIDMPPGTGDVHLTIASKLKPSGVVIVTTPQEVVLGDVRRNLDLFKSEGFPIIGLVENMSYMVCENCNHENHPFHKSEEFIDDIEVLVNLPLQKEVSISADKGVPLVLADEESNITKIYTELADKVVEFTQK